MSICRRWIPQFWNRCSRKWARSTSTSSKPASKYASPASKDLPMSAADYRELRLADGRTLAYAEYGRPDGQPIIYCHGSPSLRVEGDLFLHSATLADLGLRVIVPDRPGMGRSDFQPGRRIVDWPSDVLELARALEFDTFAVLGSSGGAPYAAACGALIPDRVRIVGLLGG